jgi:hypothetical protein
MMYLIDALVPARANEALVILGTPSANFTPTLRPPLPLCCPGYNEPRLGLECRMKFAVGVIIFTNPVCAMPYAGFVMCMALAIKFYAPHAHLHHFAAQTTMSRGRAWNAG